MLKSECWARFAGKFREAVNREGFTTPNGTLGIVVPGALDESLFLAIAPQHPRRYVGVRLPSWLQRRGSAGLQDPAAPSRETELRVLTLPASRDVLARQGIELISYRDLV